MQTQSRTEHGTASPGVCNVQIQSRAEHGTASLGEWIAY